jgi:hypothetical protein
MIENALSLRQQFGDAAFFDALNKTNGGASAALYP